MAWQIEVSTLGQRSVAQLDPQARKRILKFLQQRVATLENPRSIGEALKGSRLGELWKYRVGDYRIIADIQDKRVCILVVRIGNRRDVYK